jgi:hypothetical protein
VAQQDPPPGRRLGPGDVAEALDQRIEQLRAGAIVGGVAL